jgi:mono/diheme cytochrome c family protein
MKRWMTLCTFAIAAGVAAAQTQARSVWDGVYTEAQAARGEKLSAAHCTRCHGQTLAGAEAAPGLVGDSFNANWDGVPLGDLFERMRVSMPLDSPGTLSRQQNADVIAYLLKLGKRPAGEVELPPDLAALGQITYLGNRP